MTIEGLGLGLIVYITQIIETTMVATLGCALIGVPEKLTQWPVQN